MAKVLIACEESQAVTIEMRKIGIEAYSCDIMPCSGSHPEWHLQQDVLPLLKEDWDMIIAFPPCTYLTTAGIRWFNEDRYGDKARERKRKRQKALEFVLSIYNGPCSMIAIENPMGFLNSLWRKPNQIIQPYFFGDMESKRTCLWLKGLPRLVHTKIVSPRVYGIYKKGRHKGEKIYWHTILPNTGDRAALRSKTFPGIARAMANQWGRLLIDEEYYNTNKWRIMPQHQQPGLALE